LQRKATEIQGKRH